MNTPSSCSPRAEVLLGVCGGIAAYKAAEIVRLLRAEGLGVSCALTRSATSFVSPLTLEVLSGRPVLQQEYLSPTGSGEEAHIVAAQRADLLLVAPATAHLLARLAHGLADDFLTTTALAFSGPVAVAPAMHAEMWSHDAVRANVATLEKRGVRFIGPVAGPLASGEVGMGRLAEPRTIADAAIALLAAGPLAGRRVVISAGPTHEPIDPVRFLGNRSSGKMGFALAAAAVRAGAQTVLVAGPVSLTTPPGVERIDVDTALEMQEAVEERAAGADIVIMTAAVADFRPRSSWAGKIKRERGVPKIELTANPDILAGLGKVAPQALRVGFAAETDPDENAARAKLARKDADFLVVNDVSRSDIGFGVDDNEVTVYTRSGASTHFSRRPKARLAQDLIALFRDALATREQERHAVDAG